MSFRHGSNERDSASSTRKVQPCHPERSEGSCMDYQHRNWVKVTTSYPKKAEKTSMKRHFLEVRCADPARVTMLVTHTDLAAGRERPFASLRMTRYHCSNGQEHFVQIEPCLNKISWIS